MRDDANRRQDLVDTMVEDLFGLPTNTISMGFQLESCNFSCDDALANPFRTDSILLFGPKEDTGFDDTGPFYNIVQSLKSATANKILP